ncbi:MAG TPA: peptidylprolyl isomerase [Pseudonocardiaceae bacterium]|nr:peptidylprolyl isomerase [Pseudonocardiaceae bacterium]
MPSNEQRRQAAKRKLERQLARRAERAKRRRTRLATITVIAVLVIGGGIALIVTTRGGSSQASGTSPTTSAAPPPAKTSGGPCKYTSTPSQPAPKGKNEGLPTDPNPTPKTGTVALTLKTNDGDIPLTLDRTEAPCTVQSFVYLAQKTYFNNTPCHRLTDYTTPPLNVLQCGDPTGTGSGGPGFTIPDEKPKNLKPAPTTAPPSQGEEAADIYPAGTLAMANTGQPNSGGSQFVRVYADSQLPPDYTVFGTIAPEGLTTLHKIAAAGLTPGTDPNSGSPTPNDGKPKMAVTIQQAVVGSASS